MKINKDSAISDLVEVYLDGERLDRCTWADLKKGEAGVLLVNESGKQRFDADFNPVTEIRRGRIELRPLPGEEERVRWFMFGWAEGTWAVEAERAARERNQGDERSLR